jgi:hypothetical protein
VAASTASSSQVIDVSSPKIFDSRSNVTSIIATGNQMMIFTHVTSYLGEDQDDLPFVVITEIRDHDDISVFVAWQSGMLQTRGGSRMGFSWLQEKPGEYVIRTFVISNLENPQIFTSIRDSPLIVTNDAALLPNSTQRITLLDEVTMPFSRELTNQNYSAKALSDQHQKLCGEGYSEYTTMIASMQDDDPDLVYWRPLGILFQHLQPRETIYKQPCLFEADSYSFENVNYILRDNDTIRVDDSMTIDMLDIKTPLQAVEYLSYFSYHLDSGGSVGIIPSLSDYSGWKRDCEITSDSPIRSIRVTEYPREENRPIIVEWNTVNGDTGSIEYHKWRFDSNSEPPVLLSTLKLGQCTMNA